MTTPSPGDRPEPAVQPRSRRKAWVWWGIVTGVPLLLLVLMTAAAWIISGWQASQRLAVLVEKVRARGEPLTTIELNDYYKPATGRPDMTAEITAALALCGAKELKPIEKDLPIVGMAPEPPSPSRPWPQLAEVEAYLRRQSAVLETIHDFSRRDGTARFPVDFNRGIATALPHVAAWRQGARVLSLQFHVDLHRGRPREATDCILAQIGLARALEQEPVLVSQLVRLAIVAMAMGNAQTMVRQVAIDDTDLARLQDGLRKFDDVPCLKRALAGERTFRYVACALAGPMPDERDVAVNPGEVGELATRPPQRVRDAAKMLEISLRVAEAADESLAAARRASEGVDAELQELQGQVLAKRLYALTLLMSTSYEPSVSAFMRSAARRACADAAFAAERSRLRYGQWPETLEQLVPEYLPAVPVDPFNDEPVKMVVTDDGLTIYSVGRDGEDNQGKLSIREEPQTDLGFVVPTRRGEAPQSPP